MTQNHLSPHDHFVRNMMADRVIAQEFFEQHLPKHIKDIVQFNTLQLQSESFIDDDLKMKMADLVYKTQFGNQPGYLFLLLEHQSKPDKWMAFQLLKYSVAIMEKHVKQLNAKELPVVYPMVLYNGKQKYNYSRNLFDLFGEQKTLANSILFAPFHLIDLGQIPDQQLEEYFWSGVLTRTLKHIYEEDILPFLKNSLLKDLQIIEKRGKEDYIYRIVKYITLAGKVDHPEEFWKTLEDNLSDNTREGIMTIAQMLQQEARQEGWLLGIAEGEARGKTEGKTEGRTEGRLEGKFEAFKEIALKLLQQGMSMNQIAQLTELSIQEIEEIQQQSIPED